MPLFAEEGIWVDAGALTRSCLTQLFATMDSGTLLTRWTYYSGDFRGATARSGLFRRRPLVHLSVLGGSRFLLRQSAQPPLMQDQIPILVMVCPSRKQRPAFPYQCPGFGSQGSKSSHKIRAVCLIIDNLPLFNASHHHVVQRPWTIEPRMSRHIFSADSDPLCHLSS